VSSHENTAGRFQPPQLLSEDTMATLRAANFLDVALMQMCDLDSDISVPCADTPATDDRYQLVLNEQLREAAFRLSERCKKLEKG
jgi:hypothetical protein